MLEFCKNVLNKVSFDRVLFKKELIKATRWVGKQDRQRLRVWCLATFGAVHGQIIEEVFNQMP